MRSLLTAIAAIVLAVGGCSSAQPPGGPSSTTSVSASATAPAPARPYTPPPTSFVMPDTIGMYWTDVEPMLRAEGWLGVLEKGPDIADPRYTRNQIVVQSPKPGQLTGPATTVTLSFAP